jgi:hypothetical protein
MPSNAQSGNVADFYSQRTQQLARQSFQSFQAAGAQYASRPRFDPRAGKGASSKDRMHMKQRALHEHLSQLVPAMKVSPAVEHISSEQQVSVDTTTPEKKWTGYYAKAKNTLRPGVKYKWSSNANRESAIVVLSKEHVESLRSNFDVIMWYRNELDKQSYGNHQGAHSFKLFLDYVVAGFIDGLPSNPRIRMGTGEMEIPEWRLDEKQLRQQLAMTYRYLLAKYLTYTDYEEFGPADRELLLSLMKAAYLVGTRMEHEWLEDIDVNLGRVTPNTRWKKPIVRAIKVLEATDDEQKSVTDQSLQMAPHPEEACVITIPPAQAKTRPRPAKVQSRANSQKIEIIIRPQN